jgi:hypothetical protein
LIVRIIEYIIPMNLEDRKTPFSFLPLFQGKDACKRSAAGRKGLKIK